MSVLSRRYARAAFAAAEQEVGPTAGGALAADLSAFCAVMAQSEELRAVLTNPAFANARTGVVGKLTEKLALSAHAARLIERMSAAGRIALLGEVVNEVRQLGDQQAGLARAVVRTVIALSESQKGRIAQALEKCLGKRVVLEVSIDPTILGGLVCQVSDLTFDNSLRRQLDTLRGQLVGEMS